MRTGADLDYETKRSYIVTVSVRDSKKTDHTPDSVTDDTTNVTITVTNVDEEGTVTLSSSQPQEGTPLTATLTDPDFGITRLTWRWARFRR